MACVSRPSISFLTEVEIKISRIEAETMTGNAPVGFAMYEGILSFGIGKDANQIGEKGRAVKGGQAQQLV